MKRTPILIALGLAGAMVAAAPASADSAIRLGGDGFQIRLHVDNNKTAYNRGHGRVFRLAPPQIRRIVSRNGYRDIKQPQLLPHRNLYLVQAENRRGGDVRLTVDARTGRILDVDRIERKQRRRDHVQAPAKKRPGRFAKKH